MMHDHRRHFVPIVNETAIAAVYSLAERLSNDSLASWARRTGACWFDLDQLDPGSFSLVFEHCGQCRPGSIMNVPRQIWTIGEHRFDL